MMPLNREILDFQPYRNTTADLPSNSPPAKGRLRYVTDGQRGFYYDTGTAWASLDNIATIEDFGGVGDGNPASASINDAAIAAALASIPNGGAVRFSAGEYYISTSIDLTNHFGVDFGGVSSGQALTPISGTRIRLTGNFPAIKVGDTSGQTVNLNPVHNYLHDFQIYGSSTGTSQHGITFASQEVASYQTAFNVCARLIIWNMGGDGIRFIDNAWVNRIYDCQIYLNDGHGINLLDEANNIGMLGNSLSFNGGDGIHADGLIYNSYVVGGEIIANTGWGINVLSTDVHAFSINSVYIENNRSGQVRDRGNGTFLTNTIAFQQAAQVGAGIDILDWGGNHGLICGVFTTGECRYILNLGAAVDPSILDLTFAATATSANVNYGTASDVYIKEADNKLTVPEFHVGSPTELSTAEGIIAQTQINGLGDGFSSVTLSRFEATAAGPNLIIAKSRNAAVGSYTIVQNGDTLGNLLFCADDGTNIETKGAHIRAIVDGTPGVNDMPTRVEILTTPDGNNTPVIRLTADSKGNVAVGASVLATNASDGFLYIPTCAGAPIGTPTAITGSLPVVIDSTNNKMYIYSTGAWRALN